MATPLVDGGFLREPWQHRTYRVPPLRESPFVYRPGKRSMTVDIINRHGVLIRGGVHLGEGERVMARLTEDVAAGLGYAVRMAAAKRD